MNREEAIKKLNSLHHKIIHTSFCNKVYEAEIEALVMAKQLLEQPKADWISCEERLPNEQNQYLVSLEGYCKPMIAYFSTENKGWYWYNSTAEMRYVIAWQPLPQSYKKEGAE